MENTTAFAIAGFEPSPDRSIYFEGAKRQEKIDLNRFKKTTFSGLVYFEAYE